VLVASNREAARALNAGDIWALIGWCASTKSFGRGRVTAAKQSLALPVQAG